MVAGVFCFYEKHLVSELKIKKKTNPKTPPALIFYRYLKGMQGSIK